MRKTLLFVLLAFAMMVAQASAAPNTGITPEQLYNNLIEINGNNNASTKVYYSRMAADPKHPKQKGFLLYREGSEATVIMTMSKDGNLSQLVCHGPSVKHNEEWKIMSFAVLRALGLGEQECADIENNKQDGEIESWVTLPLNFNDEVSVSIFRSQKDNLWHMLIYFYGSNWWE